MHHSIGPEILFSIFGIPFYNTFVSTLLVDAVLLAIVFVIYKNINRIPGTLQSIFEMLIDYFHSLVEQISGDRVKAIFPWVASFFIVILFSNFLGLLPGVGSIGFEHHGDHGEHHFIPLLRPGTSDFNMTLALAVVSVVATHSIGIRYTGLRDYLSRFFSLNPIYLFVGILELVSEVTKLFSLSFRLFGNIFAGEVVLATISGLFAFIAPIPFLMLESIVAMVQALVFAMLTMVFMSILSTPHHGEEH
ncbi:MAG TPA: F0F1 ATP synthase subunit A [Candidatus Levybacteria bacterium]|nr:F0F1 ATP synthase subunit A [Candidatus Levybacteria bacterium]